MKLSEGAATRHRVRVVQTGWAQKAPTLSESSPFLLLK